MHRNTLAVFVVVAGAGGCVDARGSFDEFGNRVVDARTGEIDAPIVSTLPDFNGEFLGVARPDYPEDRFLKFVMTYEFHPVTENTGTVNWSAQALDKITLEPVGDPFTAEDVPVAADATAEIPMIGTLDGRANTVSGSTLEIDAVVHMTVVTADFTCGVLTGTAGGGPLEGTTYGAVRLTGPVTSSTPFIYRCEDGPP